MIKISYNVKISFMHYLKWTRVMLPGVFEEFEMVYIFSLFFSFHYHCQLAKGQLYQKAGGAAAPPVPPSLWFLRACIHVFFFLRNRFIRNLELGILK